jgi:hypothetical protein
VSDQRKRTQRPAPKRNRPDGQSRLAPW